MASEASLKCKKRKRKKKEKKKKKEEFLYKNHEILIYKRGGSPVRVRVRVRVSRSVAEARVA